MPFLTPFFGWEGSPTKIDYRTKGTLILTSLLEDLAFVLRMVRPLRRNLGGSHVSTTQGASPKSPAEPRNRVLGSKKLAVSGGDQSQRLTF